MVGVEIVVVNSILSGVFMLVGVDMLILFS
jgi:hypothetical protein